jgi:KDO2-lipid IV(A) lauroyltransferase
MDYLEVELMNPISSVAKRFAPNLITSICQNMDQDQAYRLGDWIISLASRHGPLLPMEGIRSSLSAILGVPEGDSRIDQAALGFLKNLYYSYVDFFKALRGSRDDIIESIHFDPAQRKKIDDHLANGQSVVLVGPHTCGFDFGIIALTEWFPNTQLISKPAPRGEYQFMHKIRLRFGLNMTPISVAALRQAVQRLKNGGLVIISNDMPIEDGCKFKLFGKEVGLTTGHARLALKSGAAMIMVLTHRVSPGRYQVVMEEIPRPESTGDKNLDIINWSQASYVYLENYIRRWPEEWFGLIFGMFGD